MTPVTVSPRPPPGHLHSCPVSVSYCPSVGEQEAQPRPPNPCLDAVWKAWLDVAPPPQSGGELGVALSHSPERHQAEPRRLPFRGPGQGTGEPGRPAQGVGGQRLLRRVWLTSSLQGTARSRMITQLCELAWTPGAVRCPRRVGRGGRQAAPGPGSYFLAPLPEHRPLTAQGEGAVAGDRADHCRSSSRQTFL